MIQEYFEKQVVFSVNHIITIFMEKFFFMRQVWYIFPKRYFFFVSVCVFESNSDYLSDQRKNISQKLTENFTSQVT